MFMQPPYKNVVRTLFLLVLMSGASRAHAQGPTPEELNELKACNLDTARSGGKLLLLTGPKDGYYFKVGEAIVKVLGDQRNHTDHETLEVENVSTPQTSCNLLALSTRHADLALVQSDIAHDAWYGHPLGHIGPPQGVDISLVAPLYVESIHILVRPHLNLARLADLRGRRVWLGPKDSFTVVSARRILDAAGLTKKDVDALANQCPQPAYYADKPDSQPCTLIKDLGRENALNALTRLELDALFLVGPFPLDPARDNLVPKLPGGSKSRASADADRCPMIRRERLENPIKDQEVHLFNLDIDLVHRLVQDGSYIEELIPADTYCQDKATLTLGVRALLLTNRDQTDPVVSQLAKRLIQDQKAIEAELKEQVKTEQRSHRGDPITGLPAKLGLLRTRTPDSLQARYAKTITHGEIYFRPWKEFVKIGVPILVAMILILYLVLHRWGSVIGPMFADRGEFLAGLIALLLVWVSAAVLLYHYEGNVNEEYNTLPVAMVTTFLDLWPYSDGPLTSADQLYWNVCKGIALLIVGGMLVPSIRTSLGPKLGTWVKEWLLGLGQPHTAATRVSARHDHRVIINCSPRAEDLIRNLRSAGGAEGKPIVVVSERPMKFPRGPEYRGVQAVQGDPTSEECLHKAGVAQARSVAILSAWPPADPNDRRKHLRGDLADARTIQALRAVCNFCGPSGRVELIAELKSQKNRPAAQEAAHGAPVRIICEEDPSPAAGVNAK